MRAYLVARVSFWPTPCIFVPSVFSPDHFACAACALNCFSFACAAIISRRTRIYAVELLSTFLVSSCRCMSLYFVSASFVVSIFCFNSCCFCARSSVLCGSSFSCLLTAFRSVCTPRASALTFFSAVVRAVVFASKTTVIPFICPAIYFSPSIRRTCPSPPASPAALSASSVLRSFRGLRSIPGNSPAGCRGPCVVLLQLSGLYRFRR